MIPHNISLSHSRTMVGKFSSIFGAALRALRQDAAESWRFCWRHCCPRPLGFLFSAGRPRRRRLCRCAEARPSEPAATTPH